MNLLLDRIAAIQTRNGGIGPAGPELHRPERSGDLLPLLRNLEIPYRLERSFQFLGGTLLWNRFLVGIDKRDLGPGPDGRILDICTRLGMPDRLAGALRSRLPEVGFVLFGFEENDRTEILKVYLEYYDRFPEQVRDGQMKFDPFLLHRGFKWDARIESNTAVTDYYWHPMLSVTKILQRISDVYEGAGSAVPRKIAQKIVHRASERMTRRDWLYLDVTEEDSPRKSFDLNIYRARLRLKDLEPVLFQLCRCFSVSPDSFRPLFDGVSDGIVGHLAGGRNRTGNDFFTVYYDLEELPVFRYAGE